MEQVDRDHPPLWRWGFVCDMARIFKLAREVQAQGGSGPNLAPLPTVDFSRDPASLRIASDSESALGPDLNKKDGKAATVETHRVMTVLLWGTKYVSDYVRMYRMASRYKYVHTGVTGEDVNDMTRIIAFASARTWHFGDLDVQRAKGDFPDRRRLERFEELLGPPAWYLAIESADREDLAPLLLSGEFQAEAGMPVVFTQVRDMLYPPVLSINVSMLYRAPGRHSSRDIHMRCRCCGNLRVLCYIGNS